MNPLVLKFADGTAFIAGSWIIAIGLSALWLRPKSRIFRLSILSLFFLAVAVTWLSATPVPSLVLVLWTLLILCSATLSSLRESSRGLGKSAKIVYILSVAASGLLGLNECSYRLTPSIPVRSGQIVYVVGDSISAGLDAKDRPWPMILGERSGLRVVNLARFGATVESAQAQLSGITNTPAVVIVEIGGNDLIGRTDPAEFHKQLDQLLKRLHAGGNTVAMMELPLFPFSQAYGSSQRVLAKRYGTLLIPKKHFAGVLGMNDSTLDGLHLSQGGHDALAQLIFGLLNPISSVPVADK